MMPASMILSGVDNEHRLTHVIVDALRGRSRGAARARVEPTIPIGRGVASGFPIPPIFIYPFESFEGVQTTNL